MTRFTERVERDLGQIADRATPSSTAWEAIQHRIDEQDTTEPTMEVIMLAPDRNEPPTRTRTWMMVAAAVAALALIGGLIFAGTRAEEDPVPADEPEPTVPAVEPEPEAEADAVSVQYPTGANPYAVAFDGTSIWITNINDNTVSKMSTDGFRIDYETGERPSDVAFDGTSIWITNQRDGTVSKMNPDDGTTVDYPTGTSPDPNPQGVAFDGTSIWITNGADGTVSKMNPDDGTRVDYPTADNPFGVTHDGTSIWITHPGTVSKMNPDDGSVVEFAAAGAQPSRVAFDGTSIWITNSENDTVSQMNPDDGTRVDYPTGTQPFGVTFDGTSIWITNEVDATVSRMNPADGTRVDYPTGFNPSEVVSDGTSVWVANSDDDTVSKITPVADDESESAGDPDIFVATLGPQQPITGSIELVLDDRIRIEVVDAGSGTDPIIELYNPFTDPATDPAVAIDHVAINDGEYEYVIRTLNDVTGDVEVTITVD